MSCHLIQQIENQQRKEPAETFRVGEKENLQCSGCAFVLGVLIQK